MINIGGLDPNARLPNDLLGPGIALQPGQVLHGIVEAAGDGLALRIGTAVVSLAEEATATLQPGQHLTAEVVGTDRGLRLRLVPNQDAAPLPQAAPSGSVAESVSPVLFSVLKALGTGEASPRVAHLVPPNLPQTQAALRLALSVFLAQASMGEDLHVLVRVVGQAAAQGALSAQEAEPIAALVRAWLSSDSLWQTDSSPTGAVRAAAQRATQTVEFRLAAALTAGRLEPELAELDRDVRAVLGRLRQNEPFAAFLRQARQEHAFDQAAQRVLDRVSGAQLQNLRGVEAPYQFFEIPFPPNAPIRQAQVHILGEEQARERGFDRENAAVAIDLETTRLGGLWISLAIHQGECRCWIRAQTPEAVRAIDAHASELAERLKSSGYRNAQVSVSLWRGDRVSEAVNLLAHFRGVNLEA
jgi:hypothetical protein